MFGYETEWRQHSHVKVRVASLSVRTGTPKRYFIYVCVIEVDCCDS